MIDRYALRVESRRIVAAALEQIATQLCSCTRSTDATLSTVELLVDDYLKAREDDWLKPMGLNGLGGCLEARHDAARDAMGYAFARYLERELDRHQPMNKLER